MEIWPKSLDGLSTDWLKELRGLDGVQNPAVNTNKELIQSELAAEEELLHQHIILTWLLKVTQSR